MVIRVNRIRIRIRIRIRKLLILCSILEKKKNYCIFNVFSLIQAKTVTGYTVIRDILFISFSGVSRSRPSTDVPGAV